MADLTTALIAQQIMNRRYQAAVNANAIPAQWQGLPATVAGLDKKMNDLYQRVNIIPQETVKVQKEVEASANEWDTVLTIGLCIVGGLLALMNHSSSSFERTTAHTLESPFVTDWFKEMEVKGAKTLKRQGAKALRKLRPK